MKPSIDYIWLFLIFGGVFLLIVVYWMTKMTQKKQSLHLSSGSPSPTPAEASDASLQDTLAPGAPANESLQDTLVPGSDNNADMSQAKTAIMTSSDEPSLMEAKTAIMDSSMKSGDPGANSVPKESINTAKTIVTTGSNTDFDHFGSIESSDSSASHEKISRDKGKNKKAITIRDDFSSDSDADSADFEGKTMLDDGSNASLSAADFEGKTLLDDGSDFSAQLFTADEIKSAGRASKKAITIRDDFSSDSDADSADFEGKTMLDDGSNASLSAADFEGKTLLDDGSDFSAQLFTADEIKSAGRASKKGNSKGIPEDFEGKTLLDDGSGK